MSSFAPASKRRKVKEFKVGEEFFPDIGKIQYRPDAPADEVLCFRHYNAQEVVRGRTMEEWLRFSVCFWHTFRGTGADPFGFPTIHRPWDDGSDTVDNAKRRLRAAFEFFQKLGVKYWAFHDRDIAPTGSTWQETNLFLDELTDLAAELQVQTGVKLLWATCNLFANPKYANGASTNPDAHVFAMAAAQVKKGLEVAKKLGAEGFVFWGGREGYQSLLNTDVKRELDHMAAFFRMAVAYKQKIGFTGQLLIEPKPKEPMKHQYDYGRLRLFLMERGNEPWDKADDAQTAISFLKTYGLDNDFKLNIEPNHTTLAGHGHEHDVVLASKLGMLGSIDANTGSPDLGWDTDQFPMDVKNATLIMKAVLEAGGLAPGGLNFDCKVRRESIALEDMFIAHIGAMDTFARGLNNAVKILDEGILERAVKERYSSYDSGIGAKIDKGETSLEELEDHILAQGEPGSQSGQQEKYEVILNSYV